MGAMFMLMAAPLNSATANDDLRGPVVVHLSGVDPEDGKMYYWLISRAGPGPVWQIWYFDLDSEEPTTPIRAFSIEREMEESKTGTRADEDRVHKVWRKTSRRLKGLRILVDYDLRISLRADSAGVAPGGEEGIRCEGDLLIATGGRTRNLKLDMSCDTLIEVQGVYGIPGRPELIIVLSYKHAGGGCEEFEMPVLIPAE